MPVKNQSVDLSLSLCITTHLHALLCNPHLEHLRTRVSQSPMMNNIAVSKSSLNEGVQDSKLTITEQHPISYSISAMQYNQETTYSSAYLSNSQKISAHQINLNLQNCTTDDNEISIFDAQKYFNEGDEQLQNHTIKSSPSPASKTKQYNIDEFARYSSISSSSVGTYNPRNYGTRSFYATPTASSEASWNSQIGLLSNPPGTIKVSIGDPTPIAREKRKNHSPRWFFKHNCPCIGKKSTQVDDKTVAAGTRSPIHFRSITPTNPPKQHTNNNNSIPKQKSPAYKTTTRLSLEKILDQQPTRISLTAAQNINDGAAGFSFPILDPSTKTSEEPPRESLEVFHPSNHENQITKTTTDKQAEDDAASDGSSDLFELETFSTQTTTYQTYKNNQNHQNNYRRDSLDEAANFQNPRRLSVITTNSAYRRNSLEEPTTPSVAPTEGYEPSEASIDWSVTTAEGFERASVATYEDLTDREGGVESGGSRVNGLLGLSCRSEKAVLVGPGPRRVGPGLVSSVPLGTQRSGNWVYNKPPLAGRTN